jgi:D-sedoheptulose 7-phosphate isomerase
MDWKIEFLHTHPELESCVPDIEQALDLIKKCFEHGGKLLLCGNGGSAADAEHIVGELMKGYLLKRPLPEVIQNKLRAVDPVAGEELAGKLQGCLPAISLVSQGALISAIANDISADMVYAQQVIGYGREGDVLWGLSTSGNAKNVIAAFKVAKAVGMKTIALTGPTGGMLKSIADVTICAPGDQTASIQEKHQPIYHLLCALLEAEFFE